MFLKAGALSLALLLASRLLGLVRESAQAAAFGTSGVADVVVLMLTLPDWLVGVMASGGLAYALLPAWALQTPGQMASSQRRVALLLLSAGTVLAAVLILLRRPAVAGLASGLPAQLEPVAADALVWSAIAIPAALLASLWSTRLQHESDFVGMYGANLVVNVTLIIALSSVGYWGRNSAVGWMGLGLLCSMILRLGWLWWRQRRVSGGEIHDTAPADLPPAPVWLWAVLVAGLPLTLPIAARSIASIEGPGALATFNYAWKLVELPLILAIQLVATLALPAIARAFAQPDASRQAMVAARGAFALAWALACAAAAALLIGAPAVAQLLFGWGRMDATALARIAQWGATAAWGLLPQAVIAVAMAVLASQRRLKPVVFAYAVALGALGVAALGQTGDGGRLMQLLNLLYGAIAVVSLRAMGTRPWRWLPWRPMAVSLGALLLLAAAQSAGARSLSLAAGLALAALFATVVMATTWAASTELRDTLRR
jgi:peptidoglycan biosynthesis protein MviN/MurJ (putative lipid II flippase)